MTKPTDNLPNEYQIKPISIRQLALAGLVIVVLGSLITFLIINRQQQQNKQIKFNSVIIPKLIKPKQISSTPHYDESQPMIFPAPSAQNNG